MTNPDDQLAHGDHGLERPADLTATEPDQRTVIPLILANGIHGHLVLGPHTSEHGIPISVAVLNGLRTIQMTFHGLLDHKDGHELHRILGRFLTSSIK